jgi:CRP/FNR family transcriptional regulator
MLGIREKLIVILESKLIDEIISTGNVMSFKEGDVIMDYGKKIKFMPLILSGTIRVMRKDEEDREILLYYLSSNESCAMAYTCCMEAKKSEIKAIAEDNVELIGIPHEKLDEWLVKYQVGKVIYLIVLLNDLMNF